MKSVNASISFSGTITTIELVKKKKHALWLCKVLCIDPYSNIKHVSFCMVSVRSAQVISIDLLLVYLSENLLPKKFKLK